MAENRSTSAPASFPADVRISTTEMHTGGGPLRIMGVDSGYPIPECPTLLEKLAWLRTHADEYRTLVMHEPRGHYNMYGAVLVSPDLPGADLAAIFIHNEGYSPMCGHAVIALGRYAIDQGLVPAHSPETRVVIQCPCGPVTAYVTCKDNVTSDVRFTSVPCYVFALDVEVEVAGMGVVTVDVVYGGAFYALVPAPRLGLSLDTSPVSELADRAFAVTKALQATVKLHHPDSPDLAFFYGTIVTDGADHLTSTDPLPAASNVCIFANKQVVRAVRHNGAVEGGQVRTVRVVPVACSASDQAEMVDRSPCGSGVSARVALQYRRGVVSLGQKRPFRGAVAGSRFTAWPVEEVAVAGAGMGGSDVTAVRVKVCGKAHYSGSCVFTVDPTDPLAGGFLPR